MAAAVAKVALSAADLEEAQVWVEAHKADIPAAVYQAVRVLTSMRLELAAVKQRAANLLDLFRRELGLTPKSERGAAPHTKPALTDEEKLAKLKARRLKLLKEIRRYEDRLGKKRKKRQKSRSKTGAEPPDADPEFARSEEQLFTGRLGEKAEEPVQRRVNRVSHFEFPRGLHSSHDSRERNEFGVTTKVLNISVETVTDPRTGKSVTASTDDIGPPNTQVTWVGVANAVIAVVGYAIPINRLAKMLTEQNPYFTSGRLCSILDYAANLLADIYQWLGTALADAEVLMGDDTDGKVLEIDEHLKDGGELVDPPKGSLREKLADTFGRIFPKKRGQGHKRKLNVSVVIGKTVVADPRSCIYFFRAHLGSFGDLVSKIIEHRSPKFRNITIISDLATTNLLSPKLYQKFNITHVGCGAHARRPFWRHRKQDERLCYWFLSAFLVLEEIEDMIDEKGRTRANIERFRGRFGTKVWAAILKRCVSVVRGEKVYGHFWPKTSNLYGACEYIINNYEKLTAYLRDPRLPGNNNLSERVLRWDKIMQDSSKFRKTEEGRTRIDILRTIVHTCSAAEVDLKDYLMFVFKNRADVKENPQHYTPYAYALENDKTRKKSSETKTKAVH